MPATTAAAALLNVVNARKMIYAPSQPRRRSGGALAWPTAVIAPESVILAAVCLLDLATTLFWVAYRDAAEANPLMAFYLDNHGFAGFIAAKMVLLAMPLVIAEWARRRSPRFVRGALRLTILAYLTLYVFGVAQINGGISVFASHILGSKTAVAASVDMEDTGYAPSPDATESE
jgi:hypothetical protein